MEDINHQKPKKIGRPSGYTKEIGHGICTQLAEGKSLRTIIKGMSGVSMSMVMRWLNDERFREFREQYARAREMQAEVMADEIMDISDEDPMEELTTKAGKIVKRDSAGVNRNRLRVDARKWIASKLLPKKYGDRLDIDLGVDSLAAMLDRVNEDEEKERKKIHNKISGNLSIEPIDVEAIKVEDKTSD